MTKGQIYQFLKSLNILSWEDREKWVNTNCPFAPWRHKGGVDSNPSFGIRINDGGVSVFKCWSCGEIGDLGSLLMKLQYNEKQSPTNKPYNWKIAWAMVNQEEEDSEFFGFEGADYISFGEDVQGGLVEFPNTWLKSFMKGTDHPYLKSRKVYKDIAERYDIRFDLSDSRVCVPIRAWDGNLYGMQGRSVLKNPKLSHKFYQYQGQSNNLMWMGEWQSDPNKLMIICEGMFDMFQIASVYPNVIASLTSSLSDGKLERLSECSQILSFYDYGTGGDFARKKLNKYFKGSDRLIGHCYPEKAEGDPGDMTLFRITEELKSVMKWLPLSEVL